MENNDPKLQATRIIELEKGLAIWKIGIDKLREQDVNARIMDPEKFQALQNKITEDKRLESLPFVVVKNDEVRGQEFWIISGHHRVRAARMGGLQFVFCLVDETALTQDQIHAKQLAHNALQGKDDPQILKQIYDSIEDMKARIDSAIKPEELQAMLDKVQIQELSLDFPTQVISILFTKEGFKDFEQTLGTVEKSDAIFLADYAYFEPFVATARKLAKRENIRNMTGIIHKMCTIVDAYYDAKHDVEEIINAKGGQSETIASVIASDTPAVTAPETIGGQAEQVPTGDNSENPTELV